MIRRDVEKSLRNMWERGYKQGYEEALKDNTMEWIPHIDAKVDNSGKWRRKCSKCGYETNNFGCYNFCPNCGKRAVSK